MSPARDGGRAYSAPGPVRELPCPSSSSHRRCAIASTHSSTLRCVYLFVELLGKLPPRRRERVDGQVVTIDHNPIFESNWLDQRAQRIKKLQAAKAAPGATG